MRLLDAHTGDTFDGVYRDANGPIARVMGELCVFLRDHHSGGMINIDIGVVDFLAAVMTATGQTSAIVLSAFRSLETNAMLARTTFGVAETVSIFTAGRLTCGLPPTFPMQWRSRAMRRGGVGWYPRSGFIHLDTGASETGTSTNGGCRTC